MRPRDSETVDRLLEAAADLKPEAREPFLDAACGNNHALRREVATLLAAEAQAGDFLDAPALGAPVAAGSGGRVGAYELLRVLGEGGMSTVWLARRADDSYRQRVAVKLLHRALAGERHRRRFAVERQILASLDHPHITRLLDAGTTDEGLPFFVMEYVEGERIDIYCDRHRLSVEERLGLFRRVCAAVHYAHQNLVVHRDLKPGNILVTDKGEPKLLDFGIAKLLNPELVLAAPDSTATWLRPLTPLYASPEQLQGKGITTASDVYSLGLLLYQILCGRLPYDFEGKEPKEVERIVTETAPEPASSACRQGRVAEGEQGAEAVSEARRTRPEALRRRLAGDLDTILAKALSKEPQRRYASAAGLAADLERHLAGLPVQARPKSWSYQATKLLRRHRLAGAVAAAFLLTVLGSLGLLLRQSAQLSEERNRARQERDQAQRERDKAQRMASFLQDLFAASDPFDPASQQGGELSARQLLDRGARKVRRELADQPQLQAYLMNGIGEVYLELGLYDSAAALLEEAHGLRRGGDPLELAESLSSLGALQHARGQLEAARQSFQQALEIHREKLAADHPLVAASLQGVADQAYALGDHAAARPLYREALAIRRQRFGEDSPEVVRSLLQLAQVPTALGEYGEAEALLRQALATSRRILPAEHPITAAVMNNLGHVLRRWGRYQEAGELWREVLRIRRRVLGEEHPHVATILNNLGDLSWVHGQHHEAERFHRQALELNRQLLGDEHPKVIVSLSNLGVALQSQERLDEAEALYQEALELARRVYGEAHQRVLIARHNLAQLAFDRGDYGESERRFAEAVALARQILPEGHFGLANVLLGLGRSKDRNGDPAAAESLLRRALEIRRAVFEAEHPQVARAESALGECMLRMNRPEAAEPLLLRSLRILEGDPAARRVTLSTLDSLIALYEATGRQEEADRQRQVKKRTEAI